MSRETNPLLTQTREILRRYRLKARKGLGQHFLIDMEVLQTSVQAADISPDDVVVEVGPGLGVLTQELIERAGRVIAVEVDTRLASALESRFAGKPDFTVINTDVLDFDIEGAVGAGCYKLVANLPYYVAAPTLRHFLEAGNKPSRMVVMVQKEVAESMVAEPGRMGLLSVSIQLYGRPKIVRYVPADSFHPAPKVDSAIVCIDVYDHPAVEVEPVDFFRVVRAGFSAPRKQLRNSLSLGLSVEPEAAAAVLERAGILSKRRAETLTLEEWARLCHVLGGAGT